MNRKSFFKSMIAFFCAPFIPKRKNPKWMANLEFIGLREYYAKSFIQVRGWAPSLDYVLQKNLKDNIKAYEIRRKQT